MDQFKAFQLTPEQAMTVTGQGKGHRKGRRRNFLNSLSEEDKTTIKTAITNLKAGEGWMDLSKDDRRAAVKAIIAPYKEA